MDEELEQTGYAVHPESGMSEFTEGAFSDKMQAVGDVSDPVVAQIRRSYPCIICGIFRGAR